MALNIEQRGNFGSNLSINFRRDGMLLTNMIHKNLCLIQEIEYKEECLNLKSVIYRLQNLPIG